MVKHGPESKMTSLKPIQSVKQKPTYDEAMCYRLQEVKELGDIHEEYESLVEKNLTNLIMDLTQMPNDISQRRISNALSLFGHSRKRI